MHPSFTSLMHDFHVGSETNQTTFSYILPLDYTRQFVKFHFFTLLYQLFHYPNILAVPICTSLGTTKENVFIITKQTKPNPFASHSSLVNHFLERIYTGVGRLFDSVNNRWLCFFSFLSNSESENCWFWVFERKTESKNHGFWFRVQGLHFKELPTSFQDLVGSSLTF